MLQKISSWDISVVQYLFAANVTAMRSIVCRHVFSFLVYCPVIYLGCALKHLMTTVAQTKK